jgi:ribosomal protein L12E/L44/L45/RPP1/RPP2
VKTRKARFLDEMEVERIATAPDRYRALMWTLAVGGLRIEEATVLRVRDLDLKAGTTGGRTRPPVARGGSAEDADAPRSDQEADDDEEDAEEHRASEQRNDPADDEDHRDDPQDRRDASPTSLCSDQEFHVLNPPVS